MAGLTETGATVNIGEVRRPVFLRQEYRDRCYSYG